MIVPQAVADELSAGRQAGVELPELAGTGWVRICAPAGAAVLPIATDLGMRESQVLALALENPGLVAVLDDVHARHVAEALGLPLTGPLGLLLDGKAARLLPSVRSALDALDDLRFRAANARRRAAPSRRA